MNCVARTMKVKHCVWRDEQDVDDLSLTRATENGVE